ncbi:MAG: hypothetical protein R2883_07145 [Caldisericia bacterium]
MMEQITHYPKPLSENPIPYCPGCPHGIIHRLVAEVVEEMDIMEKSIIVLDTGCSTLATNNTFERHNELLTVEHAQLQLDKRALPDRFVFTYQRW